MDTATRIALAAVIVAGLTLIVSALISIYGAWFSQRSARASEASAAASRTAADAAVEGVEQSRRAADAAFQALAIANEQTAIARRARYIDETPEFTFHVVAPRDGNLAVQFRLKGGPAPLEVTARIDGLAYVNEPGSTYGLRGMPVTNHHVVVGAEMLALAKCPADTEGIQGRLRITCREVGADSEGRSWEPDQEIEWGEHPQLQLEFGD